MFANRKENHASPFTLNTRIYSCNLIKNSVRFRWRGRYNEDTDLSLRMLKAGLCTDLFNAFLQDKETTLTMRGGIRTSYIRAEHYLSLRCWFGYTPTWQNSLGVGGGPTIMLTIAG